ncbi:phage tail assembly chaperone [Chromobacterium subtsugae]|uniref:phage tail assembly chaperone n=1 Tax=Chromobacterium subtsugae TaxID=251747 RepID=UPI0006417E57|nr:hypothetical protein [Chromobacterium subtsugae]
MIEFELNGAEYRAGKLDAMKQFHLSRRLAPVIPALIPLFSLAAKGGLDNLLSNDTAGVAAAAEPLARALAEMPDDHAEFVIATCMSAVRRRQGDQWSSVWLNGVCMFDDMELDTILPLVVRVLRDNLGGFMAGLVTKQTASPPANPV